MSAAHDTAHATPSVPLRIRNLMKTVADRHGVTAEDICGPSRKAKICAARKEAMIEAKSTVKKTGDYPSFSEVGLWFGGRDHTTVMHACKDFDGPQARLNFGDAA